jgi:hypothetical protein
VVEDGEALQAPQGKRKRSGIRLAWRDLSKASPSLRFLRRPVKSLVGAGTAKIRRYALHGSVTKEVQFLPA